MSITARKTSESTAAPAPDNTATTASIGFLTDMIGRLHWRTVAGRGAWEACMATLLLALEPHCKKRRILDSLPVARKMDETGLMNTMSHLGYIGRSVSLKLEDVEPRLLPCLFIPDGREDRPLVLLDIKGDTITAYDSARNGIHTLNRRRTRGIRRGTSCFFLPYDPYRQKTSRFMRAGSGESWFYALLHRFSGTFWQILGTCLALNIFALAPPLFIMAVYDRVISPSDAQILPALVTGVMLALVAEWLLRGIRADGLAWLTARLDNLVGSRIFAHLVGLPAAMIEQASVAAQVARIKTFESVRDFFSSAVFLSFLEIPFTLIALGVMAAIAGKLVLVPLVLIGAYAALFFTMRQKIRTVIRLTAKASSAEQQFVIETFDKLRSIRINGLSPAWGEKFAQLSGRGTLFNFRLAFLGTVAETLAHALTVAAAVLTIGFGVALIWQNAMTTGALVASMILVWRILLPFYSLCTMIPRLEQLRNSIAQVNSLMDIETEAESHPATAALPALKGDVAFDNITLRYDNTDDAVFENLSLSIKAGSIVAITGRNGAGKSSVLKLVKGLYKPAAGSIRIDGYDIRQMETAELRRQIAYVPQKPDFFPGTLAENIIIGNPFATREDIETALKRADAWDETAAHLDAPVDRITLTPTLAARLSLARAYVQDAGILLLDELPNAVMNSAAGANLKAYIAESRQKRTVILVTHRGDLAGLSDIMLHLARGEKPVSGPREDVLKTVKEAA